MPPRERCCKASFIGGWINHQRISELVAWPVRSLSFIWRGQGWPARQPKHCDPLCRHPIPAVLAGRTAMSERTLFASIEGRAFPRDRSFHRPPYRYRPARRRAAADQRLWHPWPCNCAQPDAWSRAGAACYNLILSRQASGVRPSLRLNTVVICCCDAGV